MLPVRWIIVFVFACAVLTGLPGAANAQPDITWRVENPFRFFTDSADTARHRATYEALSPGERLNPILSSERQLARRHPDGWAAALSGEVCWDRTTNRHRCPDQKSSYVRPGYHRVEVQLSNLGELAQATCTWLTAPRGRAAGRGMAITQPCAEQLILEVPYPRGVNIEVHATHRLIARKRIVVRDVLIVGFGDSFASGEGNPDMPVRFSPERTADYGEPTDEIQLKGYPARIGSWSEIGDRNFIANNARWLDQACHRSLYSHQLRVALQLAIEDPHRAITFLGLACSGADITRGLFLRYKGNEWVPNPPELPQLSSVARAQCGDHPTRIRDYPETFHMRGRIPALKGTVELHRCPRERARQIDLVLVSIGGNDIGFARLVANAVLRDTSTLKLLGGWFGQVHRKEDAQQPLKNLDDRFKALNRAIHTMLHVPWEESDRVILTAYPPIALLEDGRTPCPDGRIGMDVLPAFQLDARIARESEDISEALNKIMQRQSSRRGWTYADGHRDEFVGHGICAGYLEPVLTMANELRLPRRIGGYWQPYNPANYRAYIDRKRWFRTPNDAFMTGNFHVTGSLLQSVLRSRKLRWTQLLLASTYSGAFHPTAEGQAAIADSVARKARAVLERYSGGNLQK